MDPYNLIQEQLATINSNLNNSLAKIHDEVVGLSKRVESLENNTRDRDHGLNNKFDQIEQSLLILPKLYNNQVSLIETQLFGYQYQLKRISNIITKDTENPPFANVNINPSSSVSTATNNNTGVPTSSNSNASASQQHQRAQQQAQQAQQAQQQAQQQVQQQQQQQQVQQQQAAAQQQQQSQLANAASILNPQNGGISSQNRVNSPVPLSQQSRINQANRVNQSNPTVNIPLTRGPPPSNTTLPQRRATTTATGRNFMNVPLEHERGISGLSNNVLTPQRSQSTVGTTDAADVLSGGPATDTIAGPEDDEDEDGLINEPGFHKLNPNPKSVQEVLDEYYYGYQGQPSLKYLEENQKRWRKGNKNLSKTFSRRFRVVTAVEIGTQLYSNEMGGNENLAKERVINELETLRDRDNGGRETMYWLFHHIPDHLKRKR